MERQVLIGLLLACAAAAFPLQNGDQCSASYSASQMDLLRDVTVYNDDDEPVPLVMSDDEEEPKETEEETQKDLSNRVFFYLYTDKNPIYPDQLYIGDKKTLDKSHFDPSKPIRIVTHGWINSRRSPVCTLIRKAYVEHGNYNVIVIDWSRISFRPYIWASKRVVMVGKYVARMVDFLTKNGMDMKQTTMVGHSLGAHVVGLAGYYANGTVKYIVGLDPALPEFACAGPGTRISSGDAEHVEIIHTNAGLLGYLAAIGDSDFYPNGGSKQLGCLLDVGGACSHARSYHFFAESINSPVGFKAVRCKNYSDFRRGRCKSSPLSMMGGHWHQPKAAGIYYLDTKASSPFALG